MNVPFDPPKSSRWMTVEVVALLGILIFAAALLNSSVGHAGDRAVGGLPRWSIGQPARRTPRFLRLPAGQEHSARVQYEFGRSERGHRRRGQGPSGKSRLQSAKPRAMFQKNII